MTTHLNRLLATCGLALIGLIAAAPAHADQYDFVADLDNNGVFYASITDVIDQGKLACRLMRSGAGVPAALNFVARGGYSDYETGIIVAAASLNMCPDTQPVVRAFLHPAGNGNTRT